MDLLEARGWRGWTKLERIGTARTSGGSVGLLCVSLHAEPAHLHSSERPQLRVRKVRRKRNADRHIDGRRRPYAWPRPDEPPFGDESPSQSSIGYR
jgi:hypothetical protein